MSSPSYFEALATVGVGPENLEEVLAQADFGVYVDHVEQGCVYANPALLDVFGVSWDAFRGFGWARSVHEQDTQMLRDAIHRFEEEREWIDVRYRVVRPDESVRVVHARVKAIVDASGIQLGAIGVTRDVTTEHAFQDRAAHTQKLEAIGQLAGRVAHDFNNLLTSVLCSVSLLELEPIDDEARVHTDAIHQALDHGSAITRQLLSLSRQRVDSAAIVDVDSELRGIQTLLEQLLGETITLNLELNAPGAAARIASHEVSQIVLNLCVNARDAMSGRGRIDVRTRIRDDVVELEVADAGPGIAAEIREQMFEPFFTTKPDGRGTGLGLSTVRDLVVRVGGAIEVHSSENGTRMVIVLPKLTLPLAEVRAPSESVDVVARRILLVDDNDALRQSLGYALALDGHDVKTASSVATALEMFEGFNFDVLVTDVLLGDGNGPELAKQARATHWNLAVVFISGFAGEAHEAIDVDAPRTVYLQKPFDPRRLGEAIAEVAAEDAPAAAET